MGAENGFTIFFSAAAFLSLLMAAAAHYRLQRLQRRFDAALGRTEAGSLEATLVRHFKRLGEVDHRLTDLAEEYERLAAATSLASQKISIVRFNPFGDTGGDQSFSLAVLDAQDSGYVLTSIQGREGARMYVKPIDFGTSRHTLSSEEQQSLTQAMQRVAKR